MLNRLRELTDARQSFAFETTLAGRGYLHWIEEWRSAGYRVSLLYIWLSDPDLNVARADTIGCHRGRRSRDNALCWH